MKPLLWALPAALILISLNTASQDHQMYVSPDLKSNADFMIVKQKGFAGKFEFGPYRLVSAKRGFTKTKSRGSEHQYEAKSTNSSSFLFVANGADSVIVNVDINSQQYVQESRYNGKVSSSMVQPMSKETTASIYLTGDSIEWRLSCLKNYQKPEESYFAMSDGKSEIWIKDSTKLRLSLWQYMGYEFSLNGKAIAAVQIASKRYTWIDKTLDPKTKLAVAAALATFLFTSSPGEMD